MKSNSSDRYSIVASLSENDQINVFIGKKKRQNQKMLIINEFNNSCKKSLINFIGQKMV